MLVLAQEVCTSALVRQRSPERSDRAARLLLHWWMRGLQREAWDMGAELMALALASDGLSRRTMMDAKGHNPYGVGK